MICFRTAVGFVLGWVIGSCFYWLNCSSSFGLCLCFLCMVCLLFCALLLDLFGTKYLVGWFVDVFIGCLKILAWFMLVFDWRTVECR
jgi:hypothetical protein